MANKHDVLDLYSRGVSTKEISMRLGCLPEYVRATLRRNGLARTCKEYRVDQLIKRRHELSDELKSVTNELKELGAL